MGSPMGTQPLTVPARSTLQVAPWHCCHTHLPTLLFHLLLRGGDRLIGHCLQCTEAALLMPLQPLRVSTCGLYLFNIAILHHLLF
jgi:hypothetical protein